METPEIVQTQDPQLTEQTFIIDGVHMDLANYFDVYPVNLGTREKEQLKYIYDNSKGKTMGEKMNYISKMEQKLGQPSDGSRYGKIWGWMKTMNASKL